MENIPTNRWKYFWKQASLPMVILALFTLYMGLVFTQAVQVPMVTFLYMLIVLVVWWRSMQWLIKHGQDYSQKQNRIKEAAEKRILQENGLRWIQETIDDTVVLMNKRKYSFAETYIPVLMGWSLEKIRQIDIAESVGRSYQFVEIKVEQQRDQFVWISMNGIDATKGKTILSQEPLHIDSAQFKQIQFSNEMYLAIGMERCYVYSSDFIHAYQVLGYMFKYQQKEQWSNYQCITIIEATLHGISPKNNFCKTAY